MTNPFPTFLLLNKSAQANCAYLKYARNLPHVCIIQRFRDRAFGTKCRPSYSQRNNPILWMRYNRVFVAGGSRGVGRAVIDKLVKQGSEVVALVRREDAKEELDAINGEFSHWITSKVSTCGYLSR